MHWNKTARQNLDTKIQRGVEAKSLSGVSCRISKSDLHKKAAFTLAEVLITLGIIGVVAALTIPSLIQKYQDKQFKTAYKKAYSDFSQVVSRALDNSELVEQQSSQVDNIAGEQNWKVIKSYFKITKECSPRNIYNCWVYSENNWGGYPTNSSSNSFIDASGRVWLQKTAGASVFFVDVNGDKGPNLFGKDRFTFVFADSNNNMLQAGGVVKIAPGYNRDVLTKHDFCNKPPCYYHSWLYNDL